MREIIYNKKPFDNKSELHICYRCSDEYSIYAPVAIYSVLINNPGRYIYIYFFTDYISEKKWRKIQKISQCFKNNELILIKPDPDDIKRQKEKSVKFHGWDLINISIYYQKYFPNLNKVFNFGIDSFCVGNLDEIWEQNIEDYHLIGNNNRHQKKTLFKSSSNWIGMDVSLLNLEKLRLDGISTTLMESYTIDKLGYLHDEVAYNGLCKRKFIDSDYYYIYSGSYLPRRTINNKTRLVDFYNKIKPWEIAIKGYEVFDKYIEYYNAVSKIVMVDYELPKNNIDVSRKLKKANKDFIDWFPFRSKVFGEFVYRVYWVLFHIKQKIEKRYGTSK